MTKGQTKVITRVSKAIAVLKKLIFSVAGLMLASTVWSDDLTDEDEILCASVNVIVCLDDGSCASAEPWELAVPQFIKTDLKEHTLSTTEASGDSRVTIADTAERTDARIYLQGIDRGRAYSFVIDEGTGFLTAASHQAQAEAEKHGQEQVQATEEQIGNFKKAFSVCLEAKEYMVKY